MAQKEGGEGWQMVKIYNCFVSLHAETIDWLPYHHVQEVLMKGHIIPQALSIPVSLGGSSVVLTMLNTLHTILLPTESFCQYRESVWNHMCNSPTSELSCYGHGNQLHLFTALCTVCCWFSCVTNLICCHNFVVLLS